MTRDLTVALRRLRTAPAFTAFAVVTLALGIGITTALYSVVSGIIRPNTAARDRDGLVTVTQNTTGMLSYSTFSWPEVVDLSRMQTVFSDVAAQSLFSGALGDSRTAQLVTGEAVSGNLFQLLGVPAAVGRTIRSDDDRPDAPAVVVLSDTTWRRQFGGDARVIGSSLRMAGRVFEVIGVAPATFRGISAVTGAAASVWVPLSAAPARTGARGAVFDRASRDARGLTVIGRLKTGRTLSDATIEAGTLAARLDAISPMSLGPGERRVLAAGQTFDNGRLRSALTSGALFILALPALVLLVACTNLGNLVLARGVSRTHEIAVRRALGASRWRLVSGQIVEGLVVAVAGGGAGLVVASALVAWIRTLFAQLLGGFPEFQVDARLDAGVVAAAGGFALLALVASSLVPALELTRTQDRRALTSDGGLGTTPRWRSQANLIAVQVTVSVALFLLSALGVTVLTFNTQATGWTGLERAAFVGIPFSRQQADEATVRSTLDRVLIRARAVPGVDAVEAASIASSAQRQPATAHVTVPERPFGPDIGRSGEWMAITTGTPGIFKMLGVKVKYGRPFDDRDAAGAPAVAVINEGLAGKLFMRTNAVGRDILIRTDALQPVTVTARVVGITENTVGRSGRINTDLYLPMAQHFEPDVALIARGSALEVPALVSALRTSLWQEDPDVAVGFAGRADVAVAGFAAVISGVFTAAAAWLAAITLVLSMTGLYGVLSLVVAKRTREMGLRMALGADRWRIARLVMRDGFRPIIEGLFIGLAGATVIRLLLQPSFDKPITAFDPIAIAFAIGPLLIAGAVACYLPARRAGRVDPNVALRHL